MKAVAGEDRKQLQTTLERQDRQQLVWLLLFKQQPPPGRRGQEHLRGTMLARGARSPERRINTECSGTRALRSCCGVRRVLLAGGGQTGWAGDSKGSQELLVPCQQGTHAGQGQGGLQDAFSICRAVLQQEFCLCHGGGSGGEAFPSCFLQDIPAPPDSWFPLGS